jgi:phage terminase large subunit-like protein
VDYRNLSLQEFIPAISPEFQSPRHLGDWTDLIERSIQGGIRGLCAYPIRHHKSETTYHGIAWLLVHNPKLRIIVMVADHEIANDRGKRIRQICEAAGVGPDRGTNTIVSWRNAQGGGVQIMSAKQSRLGQDVDILIFDDPLSELDADTLEVRNAVDMAIAHYTARAGGTGGKRGSVMGVMSPWHPDDPFGRRVARSAVHWEAFRRPAIIDEGLETESAFAEDVMPLEELKRRRAELYEVDPTERIWWAQFMCEPKPLGSDLFGEPTYYTKLPEYNYRRGFGVDMAFSVGEGADWFARVVGRVYGTRMYILDVKRHKIATHLIESTCKGDLVTFGYAPFYSYMSGPEIGMARMLIQRSVPIGIMKARYNKLVRAQKTIKRWNDGEILVPENAGWLKGFLHRVSIFRGHEHDSDDDEIDALVALCDAMMGSAAGGARVLGKAYAGLL